jgi:hypothetical protein
MLFATDSSSASHIDFPFALTFLLHIIDNAHFTSRSLSISLFIEASANLNSSPAYNIETTLKILLTY